MVKVSKLNSRNRVIAQTAVRLDLGCGPNKRKTDDQGRPQEWTGVDAIAFPGVDVVMDLVRKVGLGRDGEDPMPWPWPDNSIEQIHCSHLLEHFESTQRWHIMNEMYRVMKVGAKATIITPDWCSQRAYGDMTHKWPPISGFFWFYLKKDWRMANAPHNDASNVKGGLNCNFDATWGPSLHPELVNRNQEYQQHAINFWKEACQDMICTLVKA